MSLAAEAESFLGQDGPLAGAFPDFRERPVQIRMSGQVADAVTTGGTLLLEAGTGTGKTLAYLLPLLLSGKRAVVSTGTKNLQDQLYRRDLPRLLACFDQPVRTALLKGRANYLCRYRLKRAERGGARTRISGVRFLPAAAEDKEPERQCRRDVVQLVEGVTHLRAVEGYEDVVLGDTLRHGGRTKFGLERGRPDDPGAARACHRRWPDGGIAAAVRWFIGCELV